jgi:tRNA 2-thiouridine synthesizing protein A
MQPKIGYDIIKHNQIVNSFIVVRLSLARQLLTIAGSSWFTQRGEQAHPITQGGRKMTTLTQVPETASTVDCRGSACPGPLLEAKKAIGSVKVGQVLEVLSSDPGTKEDIPAWAGKVGHEFLGCTKETGYDRLFIRRKK